VSALAPAFVYANQRIDISVRAGVAICPHDGTTGDELFTRAELAMHQVDTTAEARYRFADANVHDRVRRVAMREADLRDTAAVDGFEVHYQPRVTHAGAVAFEALLRWPRARDELMAASSFVPDLERTGLMVSVGHWVLRQAIGQFVASERGRESLAYLAVNAGLVELRCDEFVARVEEALAEHGFAPHRLELGISEAVALSANKRARQALRWLRSLGVRIAIDDFGTVCPLAQCLDLVGEVDAVTIERSLVHGLERGEPRAALVSALISFGRSAGLDVVAQGIESTGELEILRGCGCEIFQGNLFSPPVPADRLAKAREDQPEAPPDVKMIADR
jgi:EAL domain-containing protein (putative c-di-GMP-specific phosphodiesterase class I)